MSFVHPGLRFRLIRMARRLLQVRDHEFAEPFFGATYAGHTGTYIDSFVYYLGGYERGALDLFAALARSEPGFVFCDVGANVGHHTLFMSQLCEVLAFEPNPELAAILEDKLRLNQVRNVRTFQVGLGSSNADLKYFRPLTSNTGTGSFIAGGYDGNAATATMLPVVQGDTFMRSQNVERIDLIKIDVEGFEGEVIKGLHDTFAGMSPTIFVEVSGRLLREAGSVERFLALFPAGYQAFAISNVFDEQVRLVPFSLDSGADKNVLLVRRPAHTVALTAAGYLATPSQA